jgi:hypothetical protein
MVFYYVNWNPYSGGRIIWQKTLHWQKLWQNSASHLIRKAVLEFQAGGVPLLPTPILIFNILYTQITLLR